MSSRQAENHIYDINKNVEARGRQDNKLDILRRLQNTEYHLFSYRRQNLLIIKDTVLTTIN